MSVLNAFLSTWSTARSTFGESTPQTGAPFDNSASLRQLQTDLGSATSGTRWTGSAASAYDAANTEHRRVIGAIAGLDQRLRSAVDQSATVVATGRGNLDAVRKWVLDAAASVPRNAAGERMLLPIVQKGITQVAEIVRSSNGDLNAIGAKIRALGTEYQALGKQKFGEGPQFAGGEGDEKGQEWKPQNEYEQALKDAGLLNAPPTGYYKEWLENAKRQGVPPSTIVDIAKRHNITPQSFDVLNKMEKVTDNDGKSYFLLPKGVRGRDARDAALMTYVLNCGTDYGEGTAHDFAPTPYSADEVQRIKDRQEANSWTYDRGVNFVQENGARLMATPNGMLMGCGGNQLQDMFSEGGGSTYGDMFMLNIDDPSSPSDTLRKVAESGHMWYPQPGGEGREGALDLDRILHHEERHSQQWANKGADRMVAEYGVELFREKVLKLPNRLEQDAGLGDGGYT